MSETVVTIKHGGITCTITEDIATCNDVMVNVLRAIVAVGFHQANVDEVILDMADEIARNQE